MGTEESAEVKKTSRVAVSRLKQERERHGLTQSEVADRIGTTQINVSRWENGNTVPGPHFRRKLAELFSKSLQELGFVKEAEEESSGQADATLLPEIPPPLWNLPHRRNPFFTGREELLHHLSTTLGKSKVAALTQAQAISGLGGIGKTQTAMEYAYRYGHLCHAVLWVTASSRDTLMNDFEALAVLLDLPEQKEQEQGTVIAAVKHWLATHKNWLLILDNVDDPQMVLEFLPTQSEGSVLLTTRLQALGSLATHVEVEKMDADEGLLFLLRRVKILKADEPLDSSSNAEQAQAAEIVAALDGLPLALDQAGAYIEETRCGFQGYLNLYRTRRKALLQRRGRLPADHPESVAATWSLSFQRIEQESPAAADLLRLCAFLHPEAIPEEILTEGAAELGPELGPVAVDPLALNEAIEHLLRYSLIRRDPEERSLGIHRLVQAVLRDAMDLDLRRTWAERALRATNRAFPDVEPTTWATCVRCLPHIQIGATYIEEYKFVIPEAARLLSKAATYLADHAHYVQAEELLQKALAIRRQILELGITGTEEYKPTFPEAAYLLSKAATYRMNHAHYAQAEELLQRALAIRQQILESDHPDTATTLNDLGRLYYTQAKYSQAELFLQQALSIRERVLGVEHADTATSLDNLASLCYSQGKYEQAEPLFQHALSIRQHIFESDHPDIAQNLNHLAELYTAQGKYDRAESLYSNALRMQRQTLGSDHPDVAKTLNNLALFYRSKGEYERSESLYLDALEIQERVWRSDHPDVAQTLDNLARLYRAQGEYAKAEPFHLRALHIRKQVFGPDHPQVAQSLYSLAKLRYSQGKYLQAEEFCQQALDIQGRWIGPNHPSLAHTLGLLAKICQVQQKYILAEECYKRALAIRENTLGLDHPLVAVIVSNLAEMYHAQGKYREALPLIIQSLDIRKRSIGQEHPYFAYSLSNLAENYLFQGDYKQAKSLYEEALAIRKKALGTTHPQIASTYHSLANLYLTLDQYAEAELLYSKALAIREQTLGPEHPDVITSLEQYAQLLRKMERADKAHEFEARAKATRASSSVTITHN